jgi:hypothetical protein
MPGWCEDSKMKRNPSNLLSFFTAQFDGSLTHADVKHFVLKKYDAIKKKELATGDLEMVKKNLIILGWIDETKPDHLQKQDQSQKPSLEAIGWVNNLENGKIIKQGIITKGAGHCLDILDEIQGNLKDFTARALESLLRHVEIKRKKALQTFSQDLSADNMFIEGLSISILFSRAARRHADLRFLNATLKMNDWYFPKFRSKVGGKPIIYYLVALTEQELSVAELLK